VTPFGRRLARLRVGGVLLLAPLTLSATACSDDVDWSDPTRIEYAPSLGVDLATMTRTASGLYLKDLTVGEGPEAQAGDLIRVGYTGWLPDGRIFDSRPSSAPVEFPLSGLIGGWQEGVPGMRPGGERLLVIPPALGYGEWGSGSIPPRSTIIFSVHLVALPGR
jgi:FKBP-type peptidyl-prolyl cis-trans isomerase FkpA